ncbi:MAG: hypothetical protein KC441_05375 [Anaerolineales bacterium]|nr:hypothetical protein [Anaerolineales bacterium]
MIQEESKKVTGVDVLAAILEDVALSPSLLDLGEQRAEYEALFWRPYLGLPVYTLYLSLKNFAACVARGVWSGVNIEMIVRSMGQGDRYAILGRQASKGRAEQPGAVETLVAEEIVYHWQRGKGKRTSHAFQVLTKLPVLTPTQVEQFERPLVEMHEWYLGAIRGIDLFTWRELEQVSLVPKAAEMYGRMWLGK